MKTKTLLIYSLFIGSLSACSVQEKDQKDQEPEDSELQAISYQTTADSDTLLMTDQMVERRFVRMPDTPQGYRVQALLEVILQEDKEQILPFVFEHYDPDFIEQVPQSDHRALLYELQQLKGAEVESFENLDGIYRIGVATADGAYGYVIDVYFEPQAPYKISGLHVL